MEQIDLNVIPNGIKPVCHVSQYDKGRQIRLNLKDGTSSYTLSGTETLELDIKKADGTVYTAEVANTESDYLVITTTQQMTAAPGDNICNIKMTKNSQVIGYLNFVLDVERSPLDGGINSVSYIYNLRQQIEDIISHMPISGGGMEDYQIELTYTEYTTNT